MSSNSAFEPPRSADGRYSEYASTPAGGALVIDRETGDEDGHFTMDTANADEVSEFVNRVISQRAKTYRLSPEDVEDVRQNALVDILAEQAKRDRPLTMATDGGLMRNIARARMYDAGAGSDRHPRDRKAFGLYRDQIAALEADGVSVNKTMREQIAENVRNSFPRNERPRADFAADYGEVSLHAPVRDDLELGDTISDEHYDAGFSSDGSAAARLMAARLTGEVDAAAAKRGAWDAIAQTVGAPMAAEYSINTGTATRHRRSVESCGGVLTCAQAWERGDLDADTERALFAPFGDLSNRECEQVTSALTKYSDYAEELWNSALSVATYRSAHRTA